MQLCVLCGSIRETGEPPVSTRAGARLADFGEVGEVGLRFAVQRVGWDKLAEEMVGRRKASLRRDCDDDKPSRER